MEKLTVINPATEEVIAELNLDNKETLERNFNLLKTAQAGLEPGGIK